MSNLNKEFQNIFFLGTVEIFWGIGMNFISMSAILPVMIKHLNANHFEIGLIPALGSLGFGIPQILSPKLFGNRRQLRKTLLYLHFLTTLPLLIVSIFLLSKTSKPAFIILSGWCLYCVLEGIVFPLWMNYMAKVTNPEKRGSSFGIIFFCQTIAGAIGVFLAGKIYGTEFEYKRSALIFFVAFLSMFIGSFFFLKTKEEGFEEEKTSPYVKLNQLTKKYKWLLYYMFSRFFSRGAFLVISSFYIVDILDRNLQTSRSAVAVGSVALVSQAFFSLFFGKIGDNISHKKASLFAVSVFFFACTCYIFGENIFLHILTAVVLGLYISAEFTSFNNLLFSLSEISDRHSMIAWYGFLNSLPQIVIPLLGGLIIDNMGMPFASLFSALILFLSIIFLTFFVPEKITTTKSPNHNLGNL